MNPSVDADLRIRLSFKVFKTSVSSSAVRGRQSTPGQLYVWTSGGCTVNSYSEVPKKLQNSDIGDFGSCFSENLPGRAPFEAVPAVFEQ